MVGGYAGLIRELVYCVQTGVSPETIGTDNVKSLAMVFGAIASAEQGRCVVRGDVDRLFFWGKSGA